MNRLQKIALYRLIVIVTALAATAITLWIVVRNRGNVYSGLFPLALVGLIHCDQMIFPIKAGEIVYDERDEMIKKKAVVTAYTVFWIMFFLCCGVAPVMIFGPHDTIHFSVLPWTFVGSAIMVRVVWSIAVLVQYGKGGRDGGE